MTSSCGASRRPGGLAGHAADPGAGKSSLRRLLAVRLHTNWWWTLGMTMRVAFLRGLAQMGSLSSVSAPHSRTLRLNCYGCCEPLDAPLAYRRKDSASASGVLSPRGPTWRRWPRNWGNRCIFSGKPSPADLAMPTIDEDRAPCRAAAAPCSSPQLPRGGF